MMQKVRVNSIVFKFRKHTVLGSQRSTHLTTFVSCQSFSLKFPTVAVPNSLWHFITEFHLTLSVYVMITSSAEVWGTSFVCTINCCYTEKRFFSSLFKKIRKRDWNFLFFWKMNDAQLEVWKKIQQWPKKCFDQLLAGQNTQQM